MVLQWTLQALEMNLVIFEILSGCFYLFYKINSLNPLNIMEQVLVIVVLHQGSEDLPRPSWTAKWAPKQTLRG